LEPTLPGKWLELLSEIAPGLKRAALMFNPDTALATLYRPSFETAARSLKVELIMAPVHSDDMGLGALYIVNDINGLLFYRFSVSNKWPIYRGEHGWTIGPQSRSGGP
jgi:hypothetical protein